MRFIITDHAKKRMKQRSISKKMIKESLNDPDMVLKGKFGRKTIHKVIKDKLLKNNIY